MTFFADWMHILNAAGVSDAVASAIITACAIVVVALLALIGTAAATLFKLFQQGRDVRAVKEQVQNDHPRNLRVEQDERHSENSVRLVTLERGQRVMFKSLNRIEDNLGIEQTTPRGSLPVKSPRKRR